MSLVSIVVITGDFARVWLFYGGDCDTAHVSEVNKALHLILNLFSTAMVSLTPAFEVVVSSIAQEVMRLMPSHRVHSENK